MLHTVGHTVCQTHRSKSTRLDTKDSILVSSQFVSAKKHIDLAAHVGGTDVIGIRCEVWNIKHKIQKYKKHKIQKYKKNILTWLRMGGRKGVSLLL